LSNLTSIYNLVQVGAQVVYSKYAGTELKFNDADHLILKDDIIGILDSDDVKDMKPLNDRILIKVCLSRNKNITIVTLSRLIGYCTALFMLF
jgi:co-chaperonin GroES (HSP10)